MPFYRVELLENVEDELFVNYAEATSEQNIRDVFSQEVLQDFSIVDIREVPASAVQDIHTSFVAEMMVKHAI